MSHIPVLRQATILASSCMLLLNAGCASLSEAQCRAGDWQAIGYRDGQTGAPLSRLSSHIKACSEFGISVNEGPYQEGRNQGLAYYCTPAVGVSEGRRGDAYMGVCPATTEPAFLDAYRLGRSVYEARQHVSALEDRQRTLLIRLRKTENKDEQRHIEADMRFLRMETEFAWEDLRMREAWANRIHY
jgi:hypothetical protein